MKSTKDAPRKIRARSADSNIRRSHRLDIRITPQLSNKVKSIQGFLYRYWNKISLAVVFEKVLFPVLNDYAAKLAKSAKKRGAK